jgi:hypothetical protein
MRSARMAGFEPPFAEASAGKRVKSCAADGGDMERRCIEERSRGGVQESLGMLTCMITLCPYIYMGYYSNSCGYRFERLTGIVDAVGDGRRVQVKSPPRDWVFHIPADAVYCS